MHQDSRMDSGVACLAVAAYPSMLSPYCIGSSTGLATLSATLAEICVPKRCTLGLSESISSPVEICRGQSKINWADLEPEAEKLPCPDPPTNHTSTRALASEVSSDDAQVARPSVDVPLSDAARQGSRPRWADLVDSDSDGMQGLISGSTVLSCKRSVGSALLCAGQEPRSLPSRHMSSLGRDGERQGPNDLVEERHLDEKQSTDCGSSHTASKSKAARRRCRRKKIARGYSQNACQQLHAEQCDASCPPLGTREMLPNVRCADQEDAEPDEDREVSCSRLVEPRRADLGSTLSGMVETPEPFPTLPLSLCGSDGDKCRAARSAVITHREELEVAAHISKAEFGCQLTNGSEAARLSEATQRISQQEIVVRNELQTTSQQQDGTAGVALSPSKGSCETRLRANRKCVGKEHHRASAHYQCAAKVATKSQCQFTVGIEAEPKFQVVRRLLGPHGQHMKHIAERSGAKLRLRGRGSNFLEGPDQLESLDPLMLCVSAPNKSSYVEAFRLTSELLENVYRQHLEFCLSSGLSVPDLHLVVHEGPRPGSC